MYFLSKFKRLIFMEKHRIAQKKIVNVKYVYYFIIKLINIILEFHLNIE